MPLSNRLAAEFFGTLWLVLGDCVSTGPALFVGGWALSQLWLFWIAPLLGAAVAGVVYCFVSGERSQAAGIEGPADLSQLTKAE